MAKHTPGPWAANPFVSQVDAFNADGALPVCQMLWPTELRSEDETRANTAIVAAAPDLYTSLSGLLAFTAFLCEQVDPDETKIGIPAAGGQIEVSLTTLMKSAADAIARAEGRA